MKKNLNAILALVVALLLLLTGCAQTQTESPAQTAQDSTEQAPSGISGNVPAESTQQTASTVTLTEIDPGYTDRDKEGTYDKEDVAANITLTDGGVTVTGGGALAEGNVVTISDAGVYVITGTLTNGSILVDAEDTDKVQIVLAGASITCADGPAIHIQEADKVFITALEGTENALADGAAYALPEGEDEPNACVYSKTDLTLNGSGVLTITGSYRHGVNSKDDLIITGGVLTVNAVEDGLRGKDGVGIAGGEIVVNAGEDGVKSAGDADKPEKGWVSLDGGNIAITAGGDGVQAATLLQVRQGEVSLMTGGGAANAVEQNHDDFFFDDGGMMGGWFDGQNHDHFDAEKPQDGTMPELPADGAAPELPEGMERPENGQVPELPADGVAPELPEGMKMPENGQVPELPANGAAPELPEGVEAPQQPDSAQTAEQPDQAVQTDASNAITSFKGLKSDGGLLLLGGVVTADCADDALHAAGDIRIAGGEITIKTGDDGVHADGSLCIEGGTVTIEEGYEGLEAYAIDVLGGTIDIHVSDDGINVTDTTAANAQFSNKFSAMEGVYLHIAGGEIRIKVDTGDGLDSNGDITMSGGSVFVSGATTGPDTAMDYNGTGVITGGVIIGMGPAQMAMNFAGDSTQCSALLTLNITAGAQLSLTDEAGGELLSWISDKAAQTLLISSPALEEGKTYKVLIDGQEATSFTAAISTEAGGEMGGVGGGKDGNERQKDGFGRGGRGSMPKESQQPAESADQA